jgi:hypothetical protein
MSVERRDFLKLGAAGVVGMLPTRTAVAGDREGEAGGLDAAIATGPILKVGIRGMCLLVHEPANHLFTVHMLDTAKLGIDAHTPRLGVQRSTLDVDATSLDPTTKEDEGTSKETWYWNLKGQDVSVLDDADAPDLDADPSHPSETQHKPILHDWRALKWTPSLNQLTGATGLIENAASYFLCSVPLKHGRISGGLPKSQIADIAMWTFKKSPADGGGVITQQAYTDTMLLTRRCNGRTPVFKIGAGKVVLKRPPTGAVILENKAPEMPTGDNHISLGHFDAFYKLVKTAYIPEYSVVPATFECGGCETDPVFCPPARYEA